MSAQEKLTVLFRSLGRHHNTFPFLFLRGGRISLFNTNVSTTTLPSRMMSTSHAGTSFAPSLSPPVTGRGFETLWRSSILISKDNVVALIVLRAYVPRTKLPTMILLLACACGFAVGGRRLACGRLKEKRGRREGYTAEGQDAGSTH